MVWQKLEVALSPSNLSLFLKADIPRAEGTFTKQSTVAGTVFRMRLFYLKARYSFVFGLP